MRTTSVDFSGTRSTYGGLAAPMFSFSPGTHAAVMEAFAETQTLFFINRFFTSASVDASGESNQSAAKQKEAELSRMLSAFAADSAIHHRKLLSVRLAELRDEINSEDDHADIEPASLLAFHQFLRDSRVNVAPFVTVTRSGELYASWACGRDRLLSLRFFSPSAIAYVMFKPTAEAVERLHGTTHLRQVSEAVALSTLEWVVA